MLLWLTTFGFSLASALLPFLPIEVYIVGAGATHHGTAAAISLGIAAGAGATVGKLVIYHAVAWGSDSSWAQKKLSKPKMREAYDLWSGRVNDRPFYAGAVMFVSASVGIPPLLALAAVAGFVRMPMWVFVPTVLVGRCVRFTLLFLGVGALIH